jgi:hypothetical protein
MLLTFISKKIKHKASSLAASLSIKVVGIDDYYRPGEFVTIVGAIGTFQPEGKAFTLTSKVCGYDFVKETRTSVQFPIAYAFPIFGNTSMAKTEDKHTVSRNAPTNSISMIIPSIC